MEQGTIFRFIKRSGFHLWVHYEPENDDFILHEIRSVKRNLKIMRSKTYKLEKIVFRFIRISPMPVIAKDKTEFIDAGRPWHTY